MIESGMQSANEMDALREQLSQLQSLVYYESGGVNANTNFSLFNHLGIVQKLRYEMANMMVVADSFRPAFDALRELAVLAKERGIYELASYSHKTSSLSLKNMLFILSDKWPENSEHTPFARLAYWVVPTLLSGASRGKDFIGNIIYYEGLLMASCGGYTPGMIRFRLMGLLGIQLSLEECVKGEI